MHVYTSLANLDIRIDQNTPIFNKRLKKIFWGGGYVPSLDPTLSGRGTLYPLGAFGASTSAPRGPQTKCLDPPLASTICILVLSSIYLRPSLLQTLH